MSPFPSDPASRFHRSSGAVGGIRASFLTGLVVILPVGVTAWLLWSFAGWVDDVVLPLVPARFLPERYIGINLHGIGIGFFLIFTVMVGWVAKGLIGKSLIRLIESVVHRMPVVRSVYSAAKQLAETIVAQSDRAFEKACLVEYPSPGRWSLGFIATPAKSEISERTPAVGEVLAVFVPTTPNPTSGFLLFLPRGDVMELEMSAEEAAKLIISGGLVYPDAPPGAKGASEP